MKLALLAARLPPANDGVGDHAVKLAHALTAAGHDVTAIVAGEAAPPQGYALELTGADFGPIATTRAIAALRALRPDALIVEYTPFLFGARSAAPLAMLLAARALRIRSVVIVHEAFHAARSGARGAWKATLLAARDAATLSLADVLAVPSRARAATLIARLPSAADRVAIVPIGANVEPPPDDRRAPSTPATIVAFGVVMPRRRLERAITAIAALTALGDDVRLDIIGRTYDATYAAEIMRLAQAHGVATRVRFLGELSPARISAALGAATAAIHAAREGSIASSGSLLALLAHGVPTVALRTRDDDDVFSGVLHYADDDASLASALHAVITEPRAALGLATSAIACYRSNFAWTTVADRIDDAVSRGGRHARLATA